MASTSKSSSRSGRPLRGQAREIVFNVYKHLKEQKQAYKILKYNVVEATANATQVSTTLVKAIAAEGAQSLARGALSFATPSGKKRPHRKRIEVDEFTKALIRRKIHEFYVTKKTSPTIAKLNRELAKDNIKFSNEYLRQLLKTMGFKWMRCQSRRMVLIEQPAIASWRANYLRDIREFQKQGKNVVYIDETYVHKTHVTPRCWQAKEEIGVTKAIGKGPRLIMIHAGGEQGFVKNALRIWQSSSSKKAKVSEDYHDDMDFNNFSKWVKESLLPNLPEQSVVVMDNASYHNKEVDKRPTLNTLKQEMQAWLTRHGVDYDPKMTKPQLLQLVATIAVDKRYQIDQLFLDAGHSVIRLPPYHADLNPIELVWGDIKGRVAENFTENMAEKKALCVKLFSEFSAEKWKKCCEHVYKIEEEYCKSDAVMDATVDAMIIQLRPDDFDDSDSNSGASDSDTDHSEYENGVRVLEFGDY